MNQTWLWILFAIVFTVSMVLDLFVFHRKAHVIPVKEALKLVGFWVALAAAFNILLFFSLGREKGVLFTTAYLLEYSLSVDNLFVFLAIFTYFAVPREAQHKVLVWGILGVIVLRGVFIFAGVELIRRFEFLTYVLGGFLIYTAIKMVTQKEREVEPDRNPIVKFSKKIIRVTPEYHGADFFTLKDGIKFATPLIIVLLPSKVLNRLFATASVPAVLGVSHDLFIVYTSNMFAVLGLRALFFAMAGLFYLFRYLSTGICVVLAFVGAKMLVVHWIHLPGNPEQQALASLGMVLTILAGSIILSIALPKKEAPAEEKTGKEAREHV